MANEVIIEEYATYDDTLPVAAIPTTTQVLSIATLSAALASTTKYVRIRSKGTGFWYKFGDSTASAAANTNGNLWLPADQAIEHRVGAGTYIDTAA
jgi:hypothetical protein